MNEPTGQLAHVFLISILDAAFLAWLALLWYRRSVRRLMREGASNQTPHAAEPAPSVSSVRVVSGQTPEFALREEQPLDGGAARSVFRLGRRRIVVAYCVGAAAYAMVITALKFLPASPQPLAVAWLAEWWTNTWPLVPTLVALLVLDRPVTLRLVLMYIVGGAIAIALFTTIGQLLMGTLNNAPLTNIFWALLSLGWTASIPLVLVALTGWRRVRAVMPLALAGTLLFGFGSMFFLEMLIRALNVEAFRSGFVSGGRMLSQEVMQDVLFMIVSLPVGWFA